MTIFRIRLKNFNLLDSKWNLTLLILFLLIFPKGGIKIAGIPLTWGYLLLGIHSLFALLRPYIVISRDRLHSFLLILPFQIYCAFCMATKGSNSFGFTISFWISFLFLPIAFFLLFSKDIETMNVSHFFKKFKFGVFFIALYGIALFLIKQTTGRFLEIPLLTINLGDLGGLENKHINRGIVFKLISTYNNGNLFGVCLLMLFPLYCLLEKSFLRKFFVKLSLILTFSRTVWLGLLFHELCYPWFIEKNKKKFLLTTFATLTVFFSCILLLISYYGFSFMFLFPSDLGGRRESLDSIQNIGLFPKEPSSTISEIVYAGLIATFGWASLPLYLLAIAGPLFFQISSRKLKPPHKCIALGLCNYLILSCSDGALLLLPTLAFYWFLNSLLHRAELDDQQVR